MIFKLEYIWGPQGKATFRNNLMWQDPCNWKKAWELEEENGLKELLLFIDWDS